MKNDWREAYRDEGYNFADEQPTDADGYAAIFWTIVSAASGLSLVAGLIIGFAVGHFIV